MLQMTCPFCRREIELDDDRRGRPARCPACGKPFRAPLEDHDVAMSARPRGGTADAVALAATVVAAAGLLLTLAGILLRASGGTLPVAPEVLRIAVIVPLGLVAVSWYAGSRGGGPMLIMASRITAYLWILALLILMFNLTKPPSPAG